jgi:predicted  nucleic acid-binding Zn-ribbon protein
MMEKVKSDESYCECPNCGARFPVSTSGDANGADECPVCGWPELLYDLNNEDDGVNENGK